MFRFAALTLSTVLIALPGVAADVDDGEALSLITGGRHAAEAKAKRERHEQALMMARILPASGWAPIPEPSPIDVLHYDLDLYLDTDRELVSGTAVVEVAAAVDGLETVELDVDLGLRVLATVLLSDGAYPADSPAPLVFEHAKDRLRVSLPRPLAVGESVRLMIPYGGRASRGGDGINWSYHAGARSIFTFAEPFGARVWFPCNDRPDDKATVELTVTAPSELTVASNGLETERVDNPDGTSTTTWSSQYQIATYLVVMNLSDYAYREWTYNTQSGSTMPVVAYLYPERADAGEADLAMTPEMIAVLADYFDEYPFVEEKYGNLTANFGGGMEHQTLTTIGDFFGDPWMEWLNVHELGHQWWGDWVTCDDWRELWLNESFATFSEHVWAEVQHGEDFAIEYARGDDPAQYFNGPLYDNPVPFSRTIYSKGGLILRMLRDVMGDAAFYEAMRTYRHAFAEDSATTEELLSIVESASGMELDWFFEQWVYGSNRPRLQYDWQAVAGPAVRLTVTQEHFNAPYFRMPMEVDVTTDAGAERHRVELDAVAEQTVDIPVGGNPNAVELNPRSLVLSHLSHASEPDLDYGPDAPDLDAGQVWSGQSSTIVLPITNTGGSDLVIDEIAMSSGSHFDIAEPTEFPLTLSPGGSVDLEIHFSSSSSGRQSDWILFQTNDPSYDNGFSYLPISGRGATRETPRMIAPSSSNAGSVPIGSHGRAIVTVVNFGAQPLVVAADLQGSRFSLGSVIPPSIASGESVPIHVRFSPEVEGPHSATLTLTSNDPANPSKQVEISGTGTAAQRIAISPAPVSFGIASEGDTQTVTIRNTGTLDLTVLDAHLDGPFAILTSEVDGGAVLQPGTVASIVLTPADTEASDLRGALVVTSDDLAVPRAIIPVSAHLTQEPEDVVGWAFPAAASAPGLGGAQWRSQGFLLNSTDTEMMLDLSFRPSVERTMPEPDLSLVVPAGHQRSVADLVTATGHHGVGAIAMRASAPGLLGVSRTFTAESEGSYGQFIPSLSVDAAYEGNTAYVLSGLAGNGGFHTNIGGFNFTDHSLSLEYTLHRPDGSQIGSGTLVLEPGAFAQRNEVFADHTANSIRGAYAVLSSPGDEARFAAYASVVDDASHDPTLILPVLPLSAPGTLLHIPVVASNPGSNQTMWRSDVAVVNLGPDPSTVSVEFFSADGSESMIEDRTVGAGAALLLEDVVRQVFSATGSGRLAITASAPGMAASSRTYNDAATGTYGQLVPALTDADAVESGQDAVVAGLSSTDGFRTNLGITSLSAVETTVAARFFDGRGDLIGEVSVAVPPGGFAQVTRVLEQRLGYTGTAWASLRSDDPGARFVAHASVVDGLSGDPVYIPAVRPVADGMGD